MTRPISVDIRSEIGMLEGVILHTPGPEVENMTPEIAERALYSDILNLSVVKKEYARFEKIVSSAARTFQVMDLLMDILKMGGVRDELTARVCANEETNHVREKLEAVPPKTMARLLVEGVLMEKDNLTRYLDKERYSLTPLHNFFFTRDSAACILNRPFICKMANKVRERETMIMEAIFRHHPLFAADLLGPCVSTKAFPDLFIEGGDVLVARDDILLLGQGARTSTRGIDCLIEHFKSERKDPVHIIVQELPYKPESFIHLDMVFTLLDTDTCMVYKPLILDSNRYLTICIRVDNGKVRITEEPDMLRALKKRGMELTPVFCGGAKDPYIQDREQWHSGANFFCLAPGVIMGYGRNTATMEELDRCGFAVQSADDVEKNGLDVHTSGKTVVSVEGAELARGGGGCRCMTLPVARKKVDWP